MVYPVGNGKPYFYIRYPDRTYGPIEGDPFKRMNLTKVLAVQLVKLDEKAVTDRLIEMLDLGDNVMLEASYKLIPQLRNYDHQAIAAKLREGIYGQVRSTVIARKGIVAFTMMSPYSSPRAKASQKQLQAQMSPQGEADEAEEPERP